MGTSFTKRALVPLVAACALVFATGVANARSLSKICGTAGMDAAAAVKAYGPTARIVPEPPNTCEIVVPMKVGHTTTENVVARVAYYPKTEWAALTDQDRHVAQRVVYLHGLGSAAVLFDIGKAPFFYSEQVDFIARSLAIFISPQADVSATAPPRTPVAPIATLASAIHAKLA